MGLRAIALAGAALALATGCHRDRAAAGMAQADYDRWRQPERVVGALELAPGDAVADIGAGGGYFTARLARAVGPRGRVVATDVDPAALIRLVSRGDLGPAPVEPRLVSADDPGLEPGSCDRVLMAQVDHLLGDRVDYLDRLRAALKPGGRVAVENRLQHRAGLLEAARRADYAVVGELAGLPGQYLVLLEPR